MASIEASLYSAGIAILLASVYVLRFIRIENFLSKLLFLLSAWLGGRIGKHDLETQVRVPHATAKEESAAPEYTSKWWTDQKQFELERRAIFSKSWLFVTHTSRFQKPGDYRTFDIVGFSFIIILGKDKQLRAFHNVCRHRAYAVTKKESGSSTVLGCRYHGWSYDTKGKLIKAPEFENVTGFEKAMNGLWELSTEVRNGMVFVKFEAGKERVKMELQESEAIMQRWKVGEMKWAHEWKTEGPFNWKLAVGNFSPRPLTKESYWHSILSAVLGTQGECLALSDNTIASQLSSGGLLTLRLLPLSTNKTLIECNIYGRTSRYTKATQYEFAMAKKEVEVEIERLALQQEELLKGHIQFHHPKQDELKKILQRHADAERRAGKEIQPAARKQSFTQEGMADDDLCKELEISFNGRGAACGANAGGLLDW